MGDSTTRIDAIEKDPELPQAALEMHVVRMGRPKVGDGSARIQVTLERRLLARADEYAIEHGMTRSQLIARGLKGILG